MLWESIVGQSFTPAEFREYVAGLSWGVWRPEFLVLHNTEGLTVPGGLTEEYIRDMEHEYRDINGWSAGPHLFVDSERIWVFSPLTAPGVHANSWNDRTVGVEMEGAYNREPFDSDRGLAVQKNAVAAVAILSAAQGLAPNTLMFHKENGETEHDCPGENVDKAAFIQAVKDYLAGEPVAGVGDQADPPRTSGDDASQGEPTMLYRVKASSLNIRSGPGTGYEAVGTIMAGETISPVESSGWIPVLLEDKSIGWLAMQYLEPAQTTPEAKPVDQSPDQALDQPMDFSTKEGTIAAIRAECLKQGIGSPEQIAYVLATVDWETGHTFKPVREAFWKDEAWRSQNLSKYYPYYGRGFVQLTWESNYHKYSEILGIDLVNQPDRAMEPSLALIILVHGFRTGAFTGKKLTDYINGDGADFVNARRCINGIDKAEEIAAIAEQFLEA